MQQAVEKFLEAHKFIEDRLISCVDGAQVEVLSLTRTRDLPIDPLQIPPHHIFRIFKECSSGIMGLDIAIPSFEAELILLGKLRLDPWVDKVFRELDRNKVENQCKPLKTSLCRF